MTRTRSHAIWSTRRDLSGCYVTVNRLNEDMVNIMFPINGTDDAGGCHVMTVSRSEARLLARRINQCLDGTVKR